MVRHRSGFEAEAGAVLVEGSFCLAAFFLVLFGACDMLRVGYVYLATHHAVQMTATWAALGEVDPDKDRVTTIKDELIRSASRFGVKLQRQKIKICPATEARDCEVEDAGYPRTDFQISVLHETFVASLHRNINLSFDAQARNELPN